MTSLIYGFDFNPAYKTVTSLPKFKDKIVFMDTETSGLIPQKGDYIGGVSYKCDGAVGYLPVRHNQYDSNCDITSARDIVEEESVTTVWHNAKFDLKMFWREGTRNRGPVHDTMIMSQIIDENRPSLALKNLMQSEFDIDTEANTALAMWMKAAGTECYLDVPVDLMTQYACDDVHYTELLFNKYWPIISSEPDLLEAYEREIKMMLRLVQIEMRGICVDLKQLKGCVKPLDAEIDRLTKLIEEEEPNFNTKSPKQKHAVLHLKRGLPLIKFTNKGAGCFDKDVLARYAEEFKDPLCLHIRDLNLAMDLRSKYVRPWLERQIGGVLFTDFIQVKARTGRLSSSPNLQNIINSLSKKKLAKLKKEGKFILPDMRRMVKARPGYVNLHLDYSGQEIRIFIHYAEDEKYAAAVNAGLDPHSYVASLIFDVDIKTIDKSGAQRKLAKTLNFAILYGAGVGKIALSMSDFRDGIPIEEAFTILCSMRQYVDRNMYFNEDGSPRLTTVYTGAERVPYSIPKVYSELAGMLREKYYTSFPKIRPLNRQIQANVKQRGYIKTYGGRRRRLDANSAYKGLNALIQGTGADIIKEATIRVGEYFDTLEEDVANILLLIHDEVVFEVREEFAAELVPKVAEIMLHPFDKPLSMPMVIDMEYEAPSWGELKEWKC